ncbi:signal peptidase I [Streptomyces sp.]|uniref:signal peptidase I n=1 Tax=Streptomyces sp. TaxID=1931 RepID=UPI002F412AF3
MSATSSSTGAIRGVPGRGGAAGAGGRVGRTVSGLVVALGSVLFLGGFVWAAVVYRPYTVPTDSMRPTVRPGDKVLAQHVPGSAVHRGDVVVFKDELWGDVPMVKRVIGVGGDTVSCCDRQGRLLVNGKPVAEGYLHGGGPASLAEFTTTVPKGELFLLGDNRAVSEDSRIHLQDAEGGSVPAGEVRARVDATAWPLGRLGMVARTSAFDALPGGGASPQGPLRLLTVLITAGAALILGGAAYGPVAKVTAMAKARPAAERVRRRR